MTLYDPTFTRYMNDAIVIELVKNVILINDVQNVYPIDDVHVYLSIAWRLAS